MNALAEELELAGHVDFVGKQDDVESFHRTSKVFALTSDAAVNHTRTYTTNKTR